MQGRGPGRLACGTLFGFWDLDFGIWSLEFGVWNLEFGVEMRSLMLFRHAKSDWGTAGARDHDRPLAPRGREAAKTMGRLLKRLDQLPETIWTSTAERARSTIQLASEAGSWNRPVIESEEIYGASHQALLDFIRSLPADCGSAMLVGHEPTFSSLASLLIGGGRLRFPTATIAAIRFDCADWTQITSGAGQLVWMMAPKLVAQL